MPGGDFIKYVGHAVNILFCLKVMVWDGRSPDSPVHTLSAHQAAVKAISWCPWQP